MNHKLGESKLVLNAIEGRIAHKVFNKQIGESVFGRVSPILGILITTGYFENGKGCLKIK